LGSTFAFRIDFTPPLAENEEAFVKFSFVITKFKVATFAELRKRIAQVKLEPRDYEYHSLFISFPIRRLLFEVMFDARCGIVPKGIEVKRGTSVFSEEQDYVIRSGKFKVEKVQDSWRLVLDRENPPLKAEYIIMWSPRP
jgi:hypothetical protein